MLSSPQALPYETFNNAFSNSSIEKSPFLMFSSWSICFIGWSSIFGILPRRFSKCSFHFFSLSDWSLAFNLALDEPFLPLISFMVFHAIADCILFAEFTIRSIFVCRYFACSVSYVDVKSALAFSNTALLPFDGFEFLREAVSFNRLLLI